MLLTGRPSTKLQRWSLSLSIPTTQPENVHTALARLHLEVTFLSTPCISRTLLPQDAMPHSGASSPATACTTTPPRETNTASRKERNYVYWFRIISTSLVGLPMHIGGIVADSFRQSSFKNTYVWSGLCHGAISAFFNSACRRELFRSNFTPWGVEIWQERAHFDGLRPANMKSSLH